MTVYVESGIFKNLYVHDVVHYTKSGVKERNRLNTSSKGRKETF